MRRGRGKTVRKQPPADGRSVNTNAAKAEWVALMVLIGKSDRDLYRKLRAEAWESVVRSGVRSSISN